MKKSLILLISVFFIFLFTSGGDTPYNYFTRLADALIHGRLYLTEAPAWLSEVVPAGQNRFYVVQPPMPAILSLPFVFLFGINFPQQIIAHIVGAFISLVSMKIATVITKSSKVGLWAALLSSVGTITWYEASTGSVWYLGQITAMLFLLLGVYESLTKKRTFYVGAYIGMAYLSRVHTILSLPFFLYALKEKVFSVEFSNLFNIFWNKGFFLYIIKKPRRFISQDIKWKYLLSFFLGLSIFLAINAAYNYARWGVIWDKGYFLIPGILNEPWFSKGMLNIEYIPDHLSLLLLKMPNIRHGFPYITPSWYGLAIWLTTPAFIFIFKSPLKNNLVKFAWLSIFLIFIVLGLRGGTGWTQFGYRYAVDFQAFVYYLLFVSIKKTGLTKAHWVLLWIGVLVNMWGVLWINKFGWVGF